MDLRDKLSHLNSVISPSARTASRTGPDIDRFIDGVEMSNSAGSFFLSSAKFPLAGLHGNTTVRLLLETDPEVYSIVGKDELLPPVDFHKLLFIDTETTGLAGGTGTVPFLIGVGYFTDTDFVVDQYFIRDYHEERAMLTALSEGINGFRTLVSYNGKCYDLNLLSSRYILSRMKNPFEKWPHLDLLFAVRRIWRRRLGDCSLTNIERQILNFHRKDDVPGFMIPGIYFSYLRSGNARELESVFLHNRWDIVTLAALMGRLGMVYQSPETTLNDALDWISLGRAREAFFYQEEAVGCYAKVLELSDDKALHLEALEAAGGCYKRLGNWESAVSAWEAMLKKGSHPLSAYEELAKFYEHQARDFDQAMTIVNSALERLSLLEELRPGQAAERDRQDLIYRLNRLKRKSSGKTDRSGERQ